MRMISTLAPIASEPPPLHPRSERLSPDRFSRLRLFGDNHLLRTGHLLMLSSTATSAIGLLYWAVATRIYGAAAVGRSYAVVSALSFLAGIGQLDLGNVLIRFVPAAGARLRRLVLGSYAVAALGALTAAALFALLAPSLLPGLAFLHSPALSAALVVGAVTYAIFVLQDGVLTGLRRPGWLLTENTVFALVKVVLLFVFAGTALRAQGIVLSWIAALIAAVLVTNGMLFTRIIRRDRPRRVSTAEHVASPGIRYVAADYAGELFWMATMSLPPIMVLNLLGPEQSAYYALAWLITHALYMMSINMGSSLVVELAREPGRIGLFQHMLKHTGLLLIGCLAAVVSGAPLVLRIFGTGYAHNGAALLQLMVISALPILVIVTAVSMARAQRRMRLVVAVYSRLCVLVLGLTGVLMRIMGVDGVGVAWLTGTSVVAAALLVRSTVWTPRARPLQPSSREPESGPAPTATNELTLSVVVCAFTLDRWDDLVDSIGSLHRQSHPPDEIILVIDHCEELAAKSRSRFHGIRVIENCERRGLSGARNAAVREVRGDVVAFLDDDAVTDHRWAEHLLAPYADPDVLGVGGHVRPNWEHGRPAWFPPEFDWVVGCTYRGMSTRAGRVRNFIGANMSFRRALLDQLGGFRHELGRVGSRPLGGEETELCIRAARPPRWPDGANPRGGRSPSCDAAAKHVGLFQGTLLFRGPVEGRRARARRSQRSSRVRARIFDFDDSVGAAASAAHWLGSRPVDHRPRAAHRSGLDRRRILRRTGPHPHAKGEAGDARRGRLLESAGEPLRRSSLAPLALCPLVLGGVSSYGGEMIFRVYLFALPALALLAAAALPEPLRGPRARRGLRNLVQPAARGMVLTAVCAAMLSGLIFGYYGKERANYFTPDEVAAARYLARQAPSGDLILAPNDDFPGAYTDYPQHPHTWFAEQNPGIARLVLTDPVGELSALSAGSPDLTSYVILTSSQAAAAGQSGALPTDGFTRIRAALEGSPANTLIYRNADAEIFRLSLAPSAEPEPVADPESVRSRP